MSGVFVYLLPESLPTGERKSPEVKFRARNGQLIPYIEIPIHDKDIARSARPPLIILELPPPGPEGGGRGPRDGAKPAPKSRRPAGSPDHRLARLPHVILKGRAA